MIKSSDIERFWSKVNVGNPGDCWNWTGKPLNTGYGNIWWSGKTRSATHVSLEIHGVTRPGSLSALHSCDNRLCVNPNHLRWGTPKDNSNDMVQRNRCPTKERHWTNTCPSKVARGETHGARTRPDRVLKGSSHGMAVLTEDQVRQIRADERPLKSISAEYRISEASVSKIRLRRTWRHVA